MNVQRKTDKEVQDKSIIFGSSWKLKNGNIKYNVILLRWMQEHIQEAVAAATTEGGNYTKYN